MEVPPEIVADDKQTLMCFKAVHKTGATMSYVVCAPVDVADPSVINWLTSALQKDKPTCSVEDWEVTYETKSILPVEVEVINFLETSSFSESGKDEESDVTPSLQVEEESNGRPPEKLSGAIDNNHGETSVTSPPRKRLDARATPIKLLPISNSTPVETLETSRKHLNDYFSDISDVQMTQEKVPTTDVEVFNLLEGFNEDVLLYILSEALVKNTSLGRLEHALSCKTGDSGQVIVEFTSVEAAHQISKIPDIEFQGIPLAIKQIFEVSNKLTTAEVEVLYLPSDFKVDVLLYILNEALSKGSNMGRHEQAVSCNKNDNGQVIVEFTSIEAATKICAKIDIEYRGTPLVLKQLVKKVCLDEVPMEELEIHNLPPDFNKDVLLYILNEHVAKDTSLGKEEHAVYCNKDEDGRVIVKFTSVEAAQKMTRNYDVEYKGVPLVLEMLLRKDVNKKLPTKDVEVHNLSSDFNEDVLLYVLSEALAESSTLGRQERAVSCRRGSNGQVIVEFTSIQAAEDISKLEVAFKGQTLVLIHIEDVPQSYSSTLSKISHGNDFDSDNFACDSPVNSDSADKQASFKDISSSGNISNFQNLILHESAQVTNISSDSEEEDKDLVLLKDSCYTIVYGVPVNLNEDDLTKIINEAMERENFLDTVNCVEHCAKNVSKNCMIVKFRSCEYANLATMLDNVVISGQKLRFQKHKDGNSIVPNVVVDSSTNVISLDSTKGINIFLRLLIKHKDSFPKHGSHEPVLESLRSKLVNFGICTTTAKIRAKRKHFKDMYAKNKRDGKTESPYYVASSVIFDDIREEVVIGTDFDPEGLDSDSDNESEETVHSRKLLTFCKVASWTVNSSKALVQICLENKEEFHRPIRRTKFWTEVMNLMVSQKYYYNEKQCEDRIKVLKAAYKDDHDEGTQTGARGPKERIPDEGTRELLQLVGELLQGSVTVQPKVTAGAGCLAKHTIADKDLEKSNPENANRTGRSRPLVLKRKESLQERKLAAFERRTEALERAFQRK